MALYHKYRPQKFSEVIGQDHISQTLRAAVKGNKLSHAYLLTGPRGTGKTTTARLLAKAFNCKNTTEGEPCDECEICQAISQGRALDVIEIDAASHTGVDDIRELIEKAQLAPNVFQKKIYIIDEVHMLSKSAFNALLKTLEEPPGHVIFILATTEIQKVPATILSRTQRYDFHRVEDDDIAKNLIRIAEAEGYKIEPEALTLIARLAEGGHRDAVSLLEQVASFSPEITRAKVAEVIGLVDSSEVTDFARTIFNDLPEEGLKIVHHLFAKGADLSVFTKEVIGFLRQVLLFKIGGKSLVRAGAGEISKLTELSENQSVDEILRIINVFVKGSLLFKETGDPILPLELMVIEGSEGVRRQASGVSEETKGTEEQKDIKTEEQVKAVISTPSSSFAERAGGEKSHHKQGDPSVTPQSLPPTRSGDDDNKKVAKATESQIPNTNPQIPETEKVSVLEMKPDLWQSVVDVAKKENSTLAALLRDAKPISITDESLTLGVKFKFHKERISDNKNRQILEKIVEELTGKKIIIKCEILDGKTTAKTPASDDELQKAAGEVFEGL